MGFSKQLTGLSILLCFCTGISSGQPKSTAYKRSKIQIGLFPGFSTNGLHPGEYDNNFSINVFTGYGHSTRYFDLNGLAGYNTASSSGISISGLANFIGGNGQVGLTDKQKRHERKTGYETSLSGFQISGLLNYVGSNVLGAQATAGFNYVNDYLIGSQFSGIFNYVGSFTIGSQISVIGNYSKKSMSGLQISVVFNATNGSYSGIQIGAFNYAGTIGTTKSPTAGYGTALQLGAVNRSGDMGGWQIGFLNLGKKVAGTQIGIINIFSSARSADYKDGPAYGLLNFGYYVNPRVYVSELFASSFGLNTGKPINARIRSAKRTLFTYNEITYSTNYNLENDIDWGVSYQAGLISFYKAPDVTSQKNYFSMMMEIGHVNWKSSSEKKINMRYAVHIEGGLRLSQKIGFIYPFVGLSYNYIPFYEGETPQFLSLNVGNGELWPGYSVGVMFH